MDDMLVRDAIRDHVSAAEPPLGLTTASVLEAGRRSRRRHAVGVAGAVAAVAAAAIALPLAITGGQSASPLDGAQVLPPVELGRGPECAEARPRPAHAIDPANGMALTPDTVEWVRYAITCHLQGVLSEQLPTYTLVVPLEPEAVAHGIPTTAPSPAPGQTPGPEGSEPAPYATGQFMLDAYIADEAGTGSFTFSLALLDPMYDEPRFAERMCRRSPEECTVSQTPDGALVLARTSVEPDTGYVIHVVEVFTDKLFIYLNSTNLGLPDEGQSTSPEVSREQPPLRLDQLVEIATDPDLRLFR